VNQHDAIAQALRLLADALEAKPAALVAGTATVTVTATASLGFTPERLAAAPPDTRIGVQELSEATGRSRSGIYKLVRDSGLPVRRLPDNSFAFVVGDVRPWFREREAIVNAFVPRMRARHGATP
jgi:predicted DNA-binding transcriptional regulator AlpA